MNEDGQGNQPQNNQGFDYNQLSPSNLSYYTTSSPLSSSTILYDMEVEEEHMSTPSAGTVRISTVDANATHNEEQQQQQQQHITSISSHHWPPPAASSTPQATIVCDTSSGSRSSSSGHSSTTDTRSEQELENELFQSIENLIRAFIDRPNRNFPYYRIMRWTTGHEPLLEYVVTVVINRPAIIL